MFVEQLLQYPGIVTQGVDFASTEIDARQVFDVVVEREEDVSVCW